MRCLLVAVTIGNSIHVLENEIGDDEFDVESFSKRLVSYVVDAIGSAIPARVEIEKLEAPDLALDALLKAINADIVHGAYRMKFYVQNGKLEERIGDVYILLVTKSASKLWVE